MAEYIDLDTQLELKVAWGNTYKPYTSALRELLDTNHIPYTTADVRPVVRGKWALCLKGEVACTNCGSRSKRKTNYCPNCGADMRKES